MLNILLRWLIFSALVILTAWIIPGLSVESFWSAMLVSIIIGLINTFIKPVLLFISFPINFLTLGLFTFVINALLLILASFITPGFEIESFWSALFGSVLLSLFAGLVNKIK